MAKPIKNTPVLKGKDALNFYKAIENNSNEKVSAEKLTSVRKNAQALKDLLIN